MAHAISIGSASLDRSPFIDLLASIEAKPLAPCRRLGSSYSPPLWAWCSPTSRAPASRPAASPRPSSWPGSRPGILRSPTGPWRTAPRSTRPSRTTSSLSTGCRTRARRCPVRRPAPRPASAGSAAASYPLRWPRRCPSSDKCPATAQETAPTGPEMVS